MGVMHFTIFNTYERYFQYSNFRIDAEQTIIMGLPPPEVDSIVSWRNFGLAHSIRDVYLKVCAPASFRVFFVN